MTHLKLLGIYLEEEEKDIIRQIAAKNRMSISTAAKILLLDNAKHLSERNVLKS